MDLFQLLDADLGVNLGRREFGVSKELLDEPGVGSAFEHQGGAGVAQQMAGTAFAQIGGVDVFADKLGEPVRGERLEEVRQKERAVVRLPDEAGADFIEVAADPCKGAVANRDHPIFAAFALPHHDGAAFVIDVAKVEMGQFGAAHSR